MRSVTSDKECWILAKYRVVSKGSLVTIKSRLARGEQVNEREVEYLKSNYTSGLFRIFYDGKRKIEYTAPMSIALDKYLKNAILTEADFWKIVAQIVKVVKTVEINGLYPNHLWMDVRTVFVNETTKEIYFIYQPLKEAENMGNAFALISDITYIEAKKSTGFQNQYLMDFQNFLNQGNHYQMEQIKEYIVRAYPQINEVIRDAEIGRSGFLTTNQIDYAEHYAGRQGYGDCEDTVCLNSEDTVVLGAEQDEDYGETTVLEATTLLVERKKLLLLHQRTGEVIAMVVADGEPFRLGKGKENNYCITGNSAVSRRHAYIVREQDNFYLSDDSSTNGTFVNGRRLEVGEQLLLSHGDGVVLADEEFTVEIK